MRGFWTALLSRAGACLLALLLCSPPAVAADLGELHRLFGIGVGEAATPPPSLRSLGSHLPCGCPDFCTADVPELGSQGAISVRWDLAGGTCHADLVTVEGNALRIAGEVTRPADLYGMSPEAIIARYGIPRIESEVGGRQLTYCGRVDTYSRPVAGALGDKLIFTAFLFDAGRLHTIRVGMGPCPRNAFPAGR